MDQLKELLEENLNENLYTIMMSNPRNKGQVSKIKVRPLLISKQLVFQITSYVGTKVFHENHSKEDVILKIINMMSTDFKQLELDSMKLHAVALVSKKGQVTVKVKTKAVLSSEVTDLSHNRTKKYLLEEGRPVGFLMDLGIQTPEGKIVKSKYDKFKQINRFLEFIDDIVPALKKEGQVTILDFGCGKSYLTFAMYYYLKEICQMDIHIIGLDLKEDVIKTCTRLKEQYQYEELEFLQGDIELYEGVKKVDMVVTLHACDTATDHALAKAVRWGAKVILSVPCCQHELNKQMKNSSLQPVLQYGLIKERMAALMTDAIRADILTEHGYETQILEFINMEHTPKNILIRAVKKDKEVNHSLGKSKGQEALEKLYEEFQISPTLSKLLHNQ
ncbi:MAG: SAM-dependent methyltransferase [Clostridiales bacterium]|nr:SAM-dependent methyltransferase [Clostridiales bacterium]